MNPPVAAREAREALLAGLADGTVEAIATDHAPHEPALKDVEFDRAPFGILGFETALALALEQLVGSGRLSLMRMVELFTAGAGRGRGPGSQNAGGEGAGAANILFTQPQALHSQRNDRQSTTLPR